MSDERFNTLDNGQRRIEGRLDQVDGRLDQVDGRLDGVDGRLNGIDSRLDGVDGRLNGIDGRLVGVDGRLDRLEAGQKRMEVQLDGGFRELENHMHVLHEDLVDKIRAVANPTDMLRREIKAGDDNVREEIGRRLDPLELVVREHSAELGRRRKR